MTAGELNAYLRGLHSVPEPSVDRIIVGSADTEIRAIGTAWTPYFKTCEAALAQGVDTLVVHEPTFYTHLDLDETQNDYYGAPKAGKAASLDMIQKKRAWLESHHLTVIRCHDVLDAVPEFGVPYAFGELLGFTKDDLVRQAPYYHVYQTPKRRAVEVAHDVAGRLEPLQQPGVAFYGDPDYPVKTVGLGTGYLSDPLRFMGLDPDLFITIDDCLQTWTQPVFHEDTGWPLVVVHHGTSEEPGIKRLSEQLENTFPDIPVTHFPQGCGYRWVTPSAGPA